MATETSYDEAALRSGLEEHAGLVQGSDLGAHLRRGAVLVVAPSASIFACAMAIATDDAARVKAWLDDATLRRPTDDEGARWPADATRRWFAVVVQPFVLVQDPPDA